MADVEQLPYVIELARDDSRDVRQAVQDELARYGPSLKEKIEELDPPPSRKQRRALQSLLKDQSRSRLLSVWPDWVELDDGVEKLEQAYELLADFQTEYIYPEPPGDLLNNLASEYRDRYNEPDVFKLATFLFEQKDLSGDRETYYHPRNSNIHHTIKEGKGLPITLSAIFKLVGHRLDLNIRGCNVPGHFLTRYHTGDHYILIDCFNGGRQIDEQRLLRQYDPHVDRSSIRRLIQSSISAEAWFRRVLRNLVRAYRKDGNYRCAQLMSMLNKYIERRHEKACDPDPIRESYFGSLDPEFVPGQIVQHHRDPFRGVIVDFDLNCRGSESWYHSTSPRPHRDQPWYTVLIDESEEARYVAESVLRPDPGVDRVHNPNVQTYFQTFRNGIYVRNDQTWMEQRP